MFSGIVQDIGEVVKIDQLRGDKSFTIKANIDLSAIQIGASIACSGCCLTLVEKDENAGTFLVEASNETLSKTNLGEWQMGTNMNLETSLRVGDEIGGHFVFGHVDGLAELLSIDPDGGSYKLQIKPPSDFLPYIAAKGSVTLDGVSLTVNDVKEDVFSINIIPHTWEVTTFNALAPGHRFHLEVDMLARYVQNMLAYDKTSQN